MWVHGPTFNEYVCMPGMSTSVPSFILQKPFKADVSFVTLSLQMRKIQI